METLKSFLLCKNLYDEINKQFQEEVNRLRKSLLLDSFKENLINTEKKFIEYVFKNMSEIPIKKFTDYFPDDDAKKQFGDYTENSIECEYRSNDCYIKINGQYIDIFIEYKKEIQDLNVYYDEIYLVEVYRIDL